MLGTLVDVIFTIANKLLLLSRVKTQLHFAVRYVVVHYSKIKLFYFHRRQSSYVATLRQGAYRIPQRPV